MRCPRCHSEFETATSICPECGINLLRNISGIMKTSVVMIAADGERGFYRSVQDVPEPLRKRLLETTTSQNSGTIVIADRAGKEQLTQVMARREDGKQTEAPKVTVEAPADAAPEQKTSRYQWLAWTGLALVLLLAIVFAVLFTRHW